jgi:hypothetical protein
MRRFMVGLALVVALGCAGCTEITVFCLSAGAPDGVRLVLTTTPTGYRCSTVVVDTLPRATTAPDSTPPR